MFDSAILKMLWAGILESLYMTVIATIFSYIVGLPMGILLITSNKGGISPRPILFKILDTITNIARSIPFLILMIAVGPMTKLIVGTRLGSTATIVPLVVAAAPFVARLVESSLLEIDAGVIEAAYSMGCSKRQIIFKVMLPEAIPSLLNGAVITITTILSYSASAGVLGGGGLGSIAINYGYNRYQTGIMFITIVLLVLLVQIFQGVGMRVVGLSDKRKS